MYVYEFQNTHTHTSMKWVGLFVIALVGLHTVDDLWDMLGNLRMSWKTYANHWIARIICLIVVPSIVYMTMFVMHFSILNHSGPGDAQMSSLFQAGLVGNDFKNNPLGKKKDSISLYNIWNVFCNIHSIN